MPVAEVEVILLRVAHCKLFVEFKELVTESKGGRMMLTGKLQEAETKNGNGRVYPKEVLMREVEKYIKGPHLELFNSY